MTKSKMSELNTDVTLEQLIEFVDELLEIKTDNLDLEALRQSKIFTRLNAVYAVQSRKLKKMLSDMDKLEHLRWKRYTGKMPASHYKEEPLHDAILKQDVDKYLSVDEKMVEAKSKLNEQDRIVKFIEESIKASKDRNWSIRAAIDFRRMIAGG